jgi:hypothetical protein
MGRANGVTVLHMAAFVLGSGMRSVHGELSTPVHCLLERTLNDLDERPRVVIEGGAAGADRWARSWARLRAIDVETYEAQWARDGRAAGPIRNQAMLINGRPDLVVAFPGGRGTADMVRRAKAAGVRVIEVSPT